MVKSLNYIRLFGLEITNGDEEPPEFFMMMFPYLILFGFCLEFCINQ